MATKPAGMSGDTLNQKFMETPLKKSLYHSIPYGEVWVNERSSEENHVLPYKYTAKEYDPEAKLTYYGARYYDAKLSRWISVDPPLISGEYLPSLEDKLSLSAQGKQYKPELDLPGMSGVFNPFNLDAYLFTHNNPVKYVDPDGREVTMVLNRDTNKLVITDNDTHESIVVESFTGGHSSDKGIVSPGSDVNEKPAPNGDYTHVDNPRPKEGHEDWFGLFKKDKRIDDYTRDGKGKKRSGIRFHLGGLSHGCLTVNKYQDKAKEKWSKIQSMLKNTKKTEIDFKAGSHFWNKTKKMTKYGELKIIGGKNESNDQ